MSEQEKIVKRIGELRTEEQNAIHELGKIRGRIAEKEKDLRDLIQAGRPAPNSEAQAPELDEAERAAQLEGRGVGESADS